MLNWMITFFILAIIAAIFGFGGLASDFAAIARFLAIIFVVLFLASLVYSALTGRRPPIPPA
jgi:uncharacterized membrane protein YtjA (UPF0391 family)